MMPGGDGRADDDLAGLLDEMDAEYGPPTAEDFVWARRALGLAG
jgi:hypothetical protein